MNPREVNANKAKNYKLGAASRAAIFLPYGRVKVAEATKIVPMRNKIEQEQPK